MPYFCRAPLLHKVKLMTADVAKLFRERLRSLRDAKGLSQTELEERIGKEANYITRSNLRIGTPPLDVIS